MQGGRCGGYWVYGDLRGSCSTGCWIRTMKRGGKLPEILADFQNAQEHFGGLLRLGEAWCFGMGSGIPTAYTDMVCIYQSIHRTGSREVGRSLQAVTAEGAVRTICQLPAEPRQTQELSQVIDRILLRNPSIQVI